MSSGINTAGSTVNPVQRTSLDTSISMTATTVLIAYRRGESQPARLPGAALCTARFLCPFPDNLVETLATFVAVLARQLGIRGGDWFN